VRVCITQNLHLRHRGLTTNVNISNFIPMLTLVISENIYIAYRSHSVITKYLADTIQTTFYSSLQGFDK
jgi:hypothetical protein